MINYTIPDFTHYCDNCKHKYVNMYDYPCNECFVEDRWEEAEEDPEEAERREDGQVN